MTPLLVLIFFPLVSVIVSVIKHVEEQLQEGIVYTGSHLENIIQHGREELHGSKTLPAD